MASGRCGPPQRKGQAVKRRVFGRANAGTAKLRLTVAQALAIPNSRDCQPYELMKRKAPLRRTPDIPIFGLANSQLKPIVECAAGEPVSSFRVESLDEIRGHFGYNAEKALPVVSYLTEAGRHGTVSFFAKRFHEPGLREAHNYEALQDHGAPIPKMYGALRGADDREMLFMERVQTSADTHPFERFRRDADLFPRFLAAAARFNAVNVTADLSDRLATGHVRSHGEFAKSISHHLAEIWEKARAGELGSDLQALSAAVGQKTDALCRLASEIAQSRAEMKKGLIHSDYWPDNTGQRYGSGETVVFDLEHVALGPRFADVANWVGPPDGAGHRHFPQHMLSGIYLEEYARSRGGDAPVSEFLQETHSLWAYQTLNGLAFSLGRALDGKGDWTKDREIVRQVYREDLHRDLQALLQELC